MRCKPSCGGRASRSRDGAGDPLGRRRRGVAGYADGRGRGDLRFPGQGLVKENYERRRFSLPGGAVHPGETPEEAVLREVLEETGAVAAIEGRIGTYQLDNGFVVHAFACSIRSGTPHVPATGEIAEVGSYRPNDVPRPVSDVLHYALRDALAGVRDVLRENLPRVS